VTLVTKQLSRYLGPIEALELAARALQYNRALEARRDAGCLIPDSCSSTLASLCDQDSEAIPVSVPDPVSGAAKVHLGIFVQRQLTELRRLGVA